jgi:CRISPR-associated protein Cmr1
MRKQPESMPPDTIEYALPETITQVREYELITPLFGGGVTKGEVDSITPIRGTEIRGHLRFWWRACRGGQFGGNVAAMKQREDEIWGKAYKKGDAPTPPEKTVQITVEMLHPGEDRAPFDKDKNKNTTQIPLYAAFPLQPEREDLKKPDYKYKTVKKGITFRLTIVFPQANKQDIEAALWAWETFGGIGARTRRGFGALRLAKIDSNRATDRDVPASTNVENWIKEKLRIHVIPGQYPSDIAHLSPETLFKVIPNQRDTLSAWGTLIKKLQDFRQYGRLKKKFAWPEPDAIRELIRTHSSIKKFPRAAFGLPIVFHFIDGWPDDPTLKEVSSDPEDKKAGERLASPLILRPLLCHDNRAVGLAVLLDGSRVRANNLVLEEKNGKTHLVQATLTPEEAKTIEPLGGQTDVLKAFMQFLS